MMWLVTLIVLAVLAWFVVRMLRQNADVGSVERDPLGQDRDGLNQPLPGQRAATEGEVEDAARTHVGGHLETHPDGVPPVDSDLIGTDLAANESAPAGGRPTSTGASATATSTASAAAPAATPAAADRERADPERSLDADAAARAAHETQDTGGTGTAVLAGIATAAGAGASAAASAARDQGSDTRDHADPAERTDQPDPDTAGSLELDGRATDSAASPREHDAADGTGADGSRTAPAGTSDTAVADAAAASPTSEPAGTPTGERDPERDDARTNAPVGDTTAEAAAREPLEPVPASAEGTSADAPADTMTADERTNAPELETAGAGMFRDRSSAHRSTLVAGTATLGVGGATAADGAAILEDGHTPAENAARLDGAGDTLADAERLAGGDTRANVQEMMKILNLRESDASRLDISKDDFARLWQGDGAASDTLVDEVATRLRRMLG